MSEVAAAAFRRRSRRFGLAAIVAFALILIVAAATAAVAAIRWEAMGQKALIRVALTWSPAVFYLWALWTLRRLFSAFAEAGLAFQPVVAPALARVGWALLLGAVTTLAASPFVLALTTRPRMGGFAAINLPALTLAVVGLALIALAAMLRRAAALESEAASLRTTLDEFF